MSKIKCSLSFHSAKLDTIPTVSGGVRDGIFNNPLVFVAPPFNQPDFQAIISDYQLKRDAYKQGGLAQKGPFLASKDALMKGMDTMADYVSKLAAGDANIITLSGFVPTKGTASEAPAPVKPTGVTVKHGSSGRLLVECDKQDQAIGYGCIMTVGAPLSASVVVNEAGQLLISEKGEPKAADNTPISTSDGMVKGTFDLNPSRKKEFINLMPGTVYYFVFYAYNAKGVSSLSDPVNIMCV